VKQLAKSVVARAQLDRWMLRGKCVVLTYHRVLPADALSPSDVSWPMAVSVETFTTQLKFIKANFDILHEADFLQWLKSSEINESQRFAVITFDDGWRDNYDYALPVLSEMNAPASLFVCTDHITSGDAFWWTVVERYYKQFGPERLMAGLESLLEDDALFSQTTAWRKKSTGNISVSEIIEALKSLPARELRQLATALSAQVPDYARDIMNWDEVRAVASAGVAIGPHTRTHAILPALSDADRADEIGGSLIDLKKRELLTSQFFCFPSGDYDAPSREAVRQAGIERSYGLGQKAVKHADRDADVIPRVNVGMHNAGDMDAFRWLLARSGAMA
jgi:peptidoglycan/xylan/chitin deacetylase (PgdA/CDA1 family)